MWIEEWKFERKEIANAADFAELRRIRDRLQQSIEVPSRSVPPFAWNLKLNELHDAIIAQAVRLSERQLASQWEVSPPLPYAFVLFGSGGRSEQTLCSDQDNGIIYADPPESERAAASEYFSGLGKVVVEALEMLGYPPCEGQVLCSGRMWNGSAGSWKAEIGRWLAEPNWEHMRYMLILADIRYLYGSAELTEIVRCLIYDSVKAAPNLLKHLLENTLNRKVSLGLFGQLITERYGDSAGGADIKYGAYIPTVNAIRLLGIACGIEESSTLRRIERLMELGFVEKEIAEDWKDAFAVQLAMRAQAPCRLENGYYQGDGKWRAQQLTPEWKRELKYSLHISQKLHDYVKQRIEEGLRP